MHTKVEQSAMAGPRTHVKPNRHILFIVNGQHDAQSLWTKLRRLCGATTGIRLRHRPGVPH